MGTNRRYADHYDRLMDEKILQRVAASGPLETLTRQELQLGELPCTTDPQPKPVRAWVRFGKTPIQVEAEACMWTPRAIAIRFRITGKEYRCWVWASAVDGTGGTDAATPRETAR